MAVEAENVTNDQGQGGWEPIPATEPIGTSDVPCPDLGKRHKWKGGDTCTVCGASKATARKQPATTTTEPAGERVSVRLGAFETLGATLWAAMGLGIRYQPVVMTQNVKREDGTEIEGKPIKEVVGNVVSMQAAMAGKRIDKAFHKASPFWYGIAARYLKKATWATELAPLLIAPTFVYALAAYPQVAANFKPQLIGLMLPVFIEQAKLAKQQRELMQQFEDINEETLREALDMIDALLGIKTPRAPGDTA